jgi:arylsulfatase A-like enzyme/Flp pilus assembly protein TadD
VKPVGVLLALALGACGAEGSPPSVLLVSIDTLRADAVSAHGRESGTTPRLDALASAGTRFANATSVAPLTLPAHASLLTGLRPGRHGLTVNGAGGGPLPVATLAERLAARGYATGAFVSAAVLDGRLGLSGGFGTYDDRLAVPGGPPQPTERRADVTVDAALAWDGWDTPSFFAFVHLFDPHAPYAAPGAPAGTDRAAYLAEVRWADTQLGRLLDGVAARARGEVLVVVLSDHGEGLGEHGEETHGLLLHGATLHVPLVFSWLRGGAGRAFAEPAQVRTDVVSLLDVAPTLGEVLGLPPLPGLDGAPVVQPRPGRALPLEARAPWVYYGFSPLVGVRRDTLQVVGAPQAAVPGWVLHDLQADAHELAGAPADSHELVASAPDPHPPREAQALLDEETLRALGYLGGAPPAVEGLPAPDPRQRMDLIVALDRANTRIVDGRPAEALALLDAVARPGEDVPELLLLRGRALRALGRAAEAADVLRRACARQPTAERLTEWGAALLARDHAAGADGRAAAAPLDAALALAPGDPRATALRGLADLLDGRPEQALGRVEPVLVDRPSDSDLLTVRLRALRALGRLEEARDAQEALRAVFPASPDLR